MVKQRMHRKKVIIDGLLLLIVLASAYGGYMLFSQWKKTNEEQQKIVSDTKAIIKSDTSENEEGGLSEQYGSTYDSIVDEVEDSDPTKWDKTMLNKAYYVLVYADKTGEFTRVGNILGSMRLAALQGLNLDNNEYGIGQKQRDAIENRAIAAQDAVLNQPEDTVQ